MDQLHHCTLLHRTCYKNVQGSPLSGFLAQPQIRVTNRFYGPNIFWVFVQMLLIVFQ